MLNYIVDFYCYELELVIEIDGQYHNWEEQCDKDILRDKQLENYGLTVLRFTEHEVRKEMQNVLRTIELHVFECNPTLFDETPEKHTPPPLSRGESHGPPALKVLPIHAKYFERD